MGSRRSSAILQQPHPWPAAPVDEPDPSLLQRPPEGCEDRSAGLRDAPLKLSDCHRANLGDPREVVLGPIDQGAGGAALGGCHTDNLSQY